MVFGVVLVAGAGYLAYRHHQKKGKGRRNRNNVNNTNPQPDANFNPNAGPYPNSTPRQQMWDDELPTYANDKGQAAPQYKHQQDWEARRSYQDLPQVNREMRTGSEKGGDVAVREKSFGY